MDSKRTLLDIFHVSESYKLPDAIMDALLSDNAESIIRLVKKVRTMTSGIYSSKSRETEKL